LDMWKTSWLTDVFDDTEILEVRTKRGRKIGKILALKTHPYKKRKYDDTVVRTLIHKLSEENARAISDHDDRIDGYAWSYDHGYDPLTGDSLKDIKSYEYFEDVKDDAGKVIGLRERKVEDYKKIDEAKVSQNVKDFVREPIHGCRGQVMPNKDNLKVMMDLIFDEKFIERIEDQAIGL
jgi:hypothetical protein